MSYHARVRILWLSVFVCMALILFLWIITFGRSFEETSKTESEFEAVSEQMKKSVREIKDQWPEISGGVGTGIDNLFDNQTSTEVSPFE
ncbi:MAG: hypothetical protein HY813_00375 [Candidatus Portnoybacteria bacterium]|nr:hypothetical protein [Candidatus Portnoybacteria bacterium]